MLPQETRYKMSWKDKEGDLVCINTQEELEIGLKEMVGELLTIHITMSGKDTAEPKKDMDITMESEETSNNENNAVPNKNIIMMPEKYLEQVKDLEGSLQTREIVKTLHDKKEMTEIIRKNPGIIIVKGMNLARKELKEGHQVVRIVEAKKILKMLDQEEERLALLFVPLIVGNDDIQVHVMGDWESQEEGDTMVMFKRRGWGDRRIRDGGFERMRGVPARRTLACRGGVWAARLLGRGRGGIVREERFTKPGDKAGKNIVIQRWKAKNLANTILTLLDAKM